MTIRPISVTFVILAVLGCGQEAAKESRLSASAEFKPNDAEFEFKGESYKFSVPGDCGRAADGSFNTLAVTLDSNGAPMPDEPHLLALSRGNWSVIDFYPGTGEQIIRVYREGSDKLEFVDGVLEFDGALGAGLTEQARLRIVCPAQGAAQIDRSVQ